MGGINNITGIRSKAAAVAEQLRSGVTGNSGVSMIVGNATTVEEGRANASDEDKECDDTFRKNGGESLFVACDFNKLIKV